jgi:hypothetical protein
VSRREPYRPEPWEQPTRKRVLRAVASKPGAEFRDLLAALGIDLPDPCPRGERREDDPSVRREVDRYMKSLRRAVSAGAVREEASKGRRRRYFPAGEQ